jgi:hypothetical protein
VSNLLQHLLNFDDPPAEPDDLPRVDGLIRLRPDTTLVELPPREGKGPYHVRFEPCPYLCLCLTATADHPSARWEHPKVVSRVCRILEFRRDLPNGGRHYTRKAGVDFSLIVPKAACELVAEPGYSYPKVQVGGERITLNASGGGGGVAGSWTDYVGVNVHALTNLALRFLKIPLKHFRELADRHGARLLSLPHGWSPQQVAHQMIAQWGLAPAAALAGGD